MQTLPKYYWDACLFIAWLKNEQRKPGEMDGLAEVVAMIDRMEAVMVTSVVTRTEVLESTLTEENKGVFDRVFKRTNCKLVVLTSDIGDLAHDIREHYRAATNKNLQTSDCQHLATAITYKCDELHTFDEDDLLPLSGNVAGHKLIICKPKGKQMMMFS